MNGLYLRIQTFIQNYKWYSPLSIYHIVFFIIFFVTIPFNKWFIGWDAVSPELNFPINFARSFSGFWQENYGVGLLGGHGFSALLPHTLVMWLFSFVLPQMLLRSLFTLLCFYLGGLGMYFLVRFLLTEGTTSITGIKSTTGNEKAMPAGRQAFGTSGTFGTFATLPRDILEYIALFCAFFYMGNLGTIQTFYIQLEAFIVHFAALPWLFFCIFLLLEKVTWKRILLFVLVNFFASVQGFIPSLFIAYGITLFLFLAVYTIQSFFCHPALDAGSNKEEIPGQARNDNQGIVILKRSTLILFLTGIVNAYWFFALAYFQISRSNIFLSAYNNLISTPHFIDVNRKYGDAFDTALLRSFMFDSFELGGKTLGAWATHQENALVVLIGLLFFALSVAGLILTIVYLKRWRGFAFSVLFIYFFVSLTTATPPFSWFTDIMQHVSPTYYQAFRTSFTKFNTGLAFSYSIFLAVGLTYLLHFIQVFLSSRARQGVAISHDKIASSHTPRNDIGKIIQEKYILIGLFTLLFFYVLPIFSGNLLYSRLLLDIPSPYKDLMTYFQTQPDGRIADFPQDCSEGWYAYTWGYFGSGFYWYGVKQPFLARSFDVWSNHNENYYWEITQALRELNYRKIDQVLAKYDVKWVLHDPNLLYCRNQRPYLIHEDLITYFNSSPSYTLVKEFKGKDTVPIRLYERKEQTSKNFVSLVQDVPSVSPPYAWSDNDIAFQTQSTYQITPTNAQIFYPFRSLFSKRPNTTPVTISETPDTLILSQKAPYDLSDYTLTLPSFANYEKILPVSFTFAPSSTGFDVMLHLGLPSIMVNKTFVTPYETTLTLGHISAVSLDDIQMSVNELPIATESGQAFRSTFYMTLPNTVEITTTTGQTLLAWDGASNSSFMDIITSPHALSLPAKKGDTLSFILPKSTDPLFPGFYATKDLTEFKPQSCQNTENESANEYEVGVDDTKNPVMRMISQNSSLCLVMTFPNIPTENGYIGVLKTQNITGDPLRLVILNKNRTVYPDGYVAKNTPQYLFIPSAFPSELGYEMHLDNLSEDPTPTINEFSGITFYAIPFHYLQRLRFHNAPSIAKGEVQNDHIRSVTHPVDTSYQVLLKPSHYTNTTLILSQSYDPAWRLYRIKNNESRIMQTIFNTFPFFFGEEEKNHVLINNWANGWNLKNEPLLPNSYFIILYLPQYAQYIGYSLLLLSIIIPAIFLIKRKR